MVGYLDTKETLGKRLVAHRGANNEAPGNTLPHIPENTIHSLREAFAKDAMYVECDVHLTKDRQIIVLHDDTLRRTARYNPEMVTTLSPEHFADILDRKIPQLDFQDEISQVDVGSYDTALSKSYRKTRISLLQEFLQELQGHPQRTLLIELKSGDKEIVQVLQQMITQSAQKYQLTTDQIYFISFDFDLISETKKVLPEYKQLLLTIATPDLDEIRPDPANPQQNIGLYYRMKDKKDLDAVILMVRQSNLDGLDVEYDPILIDEDFVNRMKRHHLMSIVWNYPKDDNSDAVRRMLDVGMDLVSTNQPEQIIEELYRF